MEIPAHDPSNDDAAIAEFHRAARKKKAVIFGVGGVLSLVFGVLALVLAFSLDPPEGTTRRYEWRLVALGVALIIAGGSFGVASYRIGSGQIDDVES
jgi:uncharacterized membrane protein HdeD (DUF308 family)